MVPHEKENILCKGQIPVGLHDLAHVLFYPCRCEHRELCIEALSEDTENFS